jgi:hypothetical protein
MRQRGAALLSGIGPGAWPESLRRKARTHPQKKGPNPRGVLKGSGGAPGPAARQEATRIGVAGARRPGRCRRKACAARGGSGSLRRLGFGFELPGRRAPATPDPREERTPARRPRRPPSSALRPPSSGIAPPLTATLTTFPTPPRANLHFSRPATAGAYCKKNRRGSHQQGLPIANGGGGGLGIPIAIPRRASRASARGGITLHTRTHHQPIRHYPTMNLSSSLRTLAISIDPGS